MKLKIAQIVFTKLKEPGSASTLLLRPRRALIPFIISKLTTELDPNTHHKLVQKS